MRDLRHVFDSSDHTVQPSRDFYVFDGASARRRNGNPQHVAPAHSALLAASKPENDRITSCQCGDAVAIAAWARCNHSRLCSAAWRGVLSQ